MVCGSIACIAELVGPSYGVIVFISELRLWVSPSVIRRNCIYTSKMYNVAMFYIAQKDTLRFF